MTGRFSYETCCVYSTADAINEMTARAVEVTFATFARHCNWVPWASTMGYATGNARGLRLKNDWHVRYFRSKYKGRRCYYVKHSAIENIFTEDSNEQLRSG